MKRKQSPLAYLFLPGCNRNEHTVMLLGSTPIKGYALDGIIWLRQPNEKERLAMLPCIVPDGFELLAQPLQT